MKKIILKSNPYGDTRTAPDDVTFEKFHDATLSHQDDVVNVMHELSVLMDCAGCKHDFTKTDENEKSFYNDFIEAKKNNSDFSKMSWYKMHVETERHHLLSHCPEDVTLIDVMEMVTDCVVAALARKGEFKAFDENDENLKKILIKALNNTAEGIVNMCEIEK